MNALCMYVLFLVIASLRLEPQVGTQKKPAFEVVSIKRSGYSPSGLQFTISEGRFRVTNATFRTLLVRAFQTPNDKPFLYSQVLGLPGWADDVRFDVEATTGTGNSPVSQADMNVMLQSALEERFGLKMHRETREARVYELVVTRKGVLKASPEIPAGTETNTTGASSTQGGPWSTRKGHRPIGGDAVLLSI